MPKFPKVAIVGAGAIGSTIAWTLLQRKAPFDISIINRNEKKSWAKAFDMNHCFPFMNGSRITHEAADKCMNADVIILTAGALPRENGTRTDVLKDNVEIFRHILPLLARNNPQAYLLNITNPVDAMAYAAGKIAGFNLNKVIGTGTTLDSMRLSQFTAEYLNLDSHQLTIPIVGEHGDSMVPLWSQATYQSQTLDPSLLSNEQKAHLLHQTKRAGWDIRVAGEHSCYAIAFSAVRIVESMFIHQDTSMLISMESTQGEFSLPASFISLPTRFDQHGCQTRYIPDMTTMELEQLNSSALIVQKQMQEVLNLL